MKFAVDLKDGSAVPYFLWDEPLTIDELRNGLMGLDSDERVRLSGKVLREARFDEALALVPLDRILAEYPAIRGHLGRRRAFWDFLVGEWLAQGLVPYGSAGPGFRRFVVSEPNAGTVLLGS